MALRHKTSLKPQEEDETCDLENEASSEQSSPSPRKSRSRSSRAVAKLVQTDPILADLFKSTVPVAAPVKDEDPATQSKVACALKGLGSLESEVINALFPTNGTPPEPMEDVAERLGMTIEEVKGIADNALRGLRGTRGAGTRISTVWN